MSCNFSLHDVTKVELTQAKTYGGCAARDLLVTHKVANQEQQFKLAIFCSTGDIAPLLTEQDHAMFEQKHGENDEYNHHWVDIACACGARKQVVFHPNKTFTVLNDGEVERHA